MLTKQKTIRLSLQGLVHSMPRTFRDQKRQLQTLKSVGCKGFLNLQQGLGRGRRKSKVGGA